jgi:hypothetical protein
MTDFNFDDIRPFNEEEALNAIPQILDQPELKAILEYLFGEGNHAELIKKGKAVKSVAEFQKHFMDVIVRKILDNTADGISTSGFDLLLSGKPRLFIANHRDITLDSSILATLLVEKNLESCEFTWGDNLLVSPFVANFGRINRMIKVYRGGKPREMLMNAQKLSAYIHKRVSIDGRSVWIAQRKGRTKDGHDQTDIGVLKMISLAGKKHLLESILKLNITPISISYEWEPCDVRKVKEIYVSQQKAYVKAADEDLQSIIGGILTPKGHIHLGLSNSINEKLEQAAPKLKSGQILNYCTELIDFEIYRNYRLWPNNFLAYDLLNQSKTYQKYYTDDTKKQLDARMQKAVDEIGKDPELVEKLFLKLYAQPLIDKLNNGLPVDEPKSEEERKQE